MASNNRKARKGDRQSSKRQKTHPKGYRATNHVIITTMTRPRSPLHESSNHNAAESCSDGDPGHGDETAPQANSALVHQASEQGEVVEGRTEIHRGSGRPDAAMQEADTQEADTQEADTQEADTQEADTQEADTQEADTQAHGTEELEPAPQQVGSRQKPQQLADDAHPAALPNKTKPGVCKLAPESVSSKGKRKRETMISSDAGPEEPEENDNALDAESIPEQIRFFDVQFDNVSKEYKVSPLQENIHDWHDLKSESTCTCEDETFRCGELVHIKLHNQPNGQRGDDVARIEEIRSLSSTDKRSLVLISWLYCPDGTLYESNHLQIVLWDTITRRTTQWQAQQVRKRQLYNVCGGKKFCSEKQAKIWRERKSHILKRTVG